MHPSTYTVNIGHGPEPKNFTMCPNDHGYSMTPVYIERNRLKSPSGVSLMPR